MTRCRLLWLSGCVFTTSVAEAQEAERRTVSGVVTDSTRMPLAYVNIVFGSSRTMSDDSGRFMIRSASRAPFRFLMRRIGFQAEEVSLPAGSDTTISVVMSPAAVRLSGITVVAPSSAKLEVRGFYDRMRDVERGINRGYFITPEDLEQRRPNFITQMLESYPSVRVLRKFGEHNAEIQGVGGCRMTVYLDGIRIIGKLNPRAEEPVNLMVKPNEIAGAEVYPRGIGAPPQYQSLNGSCGIVLIWTK